ncbi:hypothetical protein LPJ70_007012, partial [Coemansia sp. RSA 2708]
RCCARCASLGWWLRRRWLTMRRRLDAVRGRSRRAIRRTRRRLAICWATMRL